MSAARVLKIVCFLFVAFPLAACGTTAVTLKYDPVNAQQATSAQQSIAVTSVIDKRKHDPNWLGAIRGGFGNPLKTLETSTPVRDLVAAAYTDGLKARGLLASDTPKYDMRIIVNQYDSNQYVRREAHIRFAITVVDTASGKELFTDTINVDKVDGSLVTLNAGIFAEVEDLRLIANQALQEAVDKTLNDTAFTASLK